MELYKGIIVFVEIFLYLRFTKFLWAWTKFKELPHFNNACLSHFHFPFLKSFGFPSLFCLFLDYIKELKKK